MKILIVLGNKLLYTKVRMDEKEFWKIYDREKYEALREKYHSKFPNIYDKLKI